MGSTQSQPKAPAPAPERVPSLEERILQLEKRRAYVQTNIQTHMNKAHECAAQADRMGVKRFLLSSKRYESELQKIHGMLVKLEELKHAQENTRMNRDVLVSLERGAQILGQHTIAPDRADSIMDAMEEAIQSAQEVSDVFSRPMLNEPDVDAEINAMMLQRPALPTVPEIPTELPTSVVEEERVALPA